LSKRFTWKRERHFFRKKVLINKDKRLKAQKVCSLCLIWSSSRWLEGVLRIMESSSWASKSAMHYFIIKGALHRQPATQTTQRAARCEIWKARVCLKLTLSRQFPSQQLIYLLFSIRERLTFLPKCLNALVRATHKNLALRVLNRTVTILRRLEVFSSTSSVHIQNNVLLIFSEISICWHQK